MHDNLTLNKIRNQVFIYIFFVIIARNFHFVYNYHAMTHSVQTKTSASILVQTLLEMGVDSVFGYPGASVLSIYNELANTPQIRHYLARHEQAAIHAAEGYARTSGQVGVVLVTSGPGFTNTLTGIANAYADSTPLVVLAGDVSGVNKHGKIFQKVDITALSKSIAKNVFEVTKKDDIAQVLKEAFQEASTGVKGPVIIGLPRNILENEYKPQILEASIQKNDCHIDYLNEIKEISALLNNAQRPLILVGGGCIDSASEVEHFASILQIPVISTLMGIGIYPSENNLYLGMIGLNGVEAANEALSQCDLLIALGVAFSDRTTCKKNDFAKNCKVVSINLGDKYSKFQLEITADVKEFLTQCIEKQDLFAPQEKWRMEADFLKCEDEEFLMPEENYTRLHSSYVLETLSEFTRYYEPIVVTDVGQHQMLTAQFFHFNKPRKFITSGGLGTMGFGLPAAIGAHIANPNTLVLNITGDGSFQMNLQELATCREHHIPVKIIIMNNGYLGMVRQMQEKLYNNRYQVEMTNPDFTKIAEAYDLFAIRVNTKEELIPALEKAIKHDGTVIVDIAIDSFENI